MNNKALILSIFIAVLLVLLVKYSLEKPIINESFNEDYDDYDDYDPEVKYINTTNLKPVQQVQSQTPIQLPSSLDYHSSGRQSTVARYIRQIK